MYSQPALQVSFAINIDTTSYPILTADDVFWKWVSDTTTRMVMETAVHHWTISGASSLQKVFDHNPTLTGTQKYKGTNTTFL